MLNDQDDHHLQSVEALKRLVNSGASLAMSAVTLSEVLVSPTRRGVQFRDDVKYSITELVGVSVVDVDERMAEQIAQVRAAERSLSTPDAAVVATARSIGASQILTTDDRLARVDEAITPKQFLRS